MLVAGCWCIYPPGCVPGYVLFSMTTDFLKYSPEITEIQMTVSIQNSQWYTGDCTAWQKGPENVPRLLTLIFHCLLSFPSHRQRQAVRQLWVSDKVFLGVMMKLFLQPKLYQRKWPPCLPSRLTGKVRACVSAFRRDSLVCHTYFHHIKSSSSFS